MKRRCSALLLALILLWTAAWPAWAASTEQTQAALELVELGLFRGTGTGLELDRAPTRQESVVLLIRLLGQEDAALAVGGSHPFGDVDAWAQDYVGWAYETGLTRGVSDTALGADEPVSAQQYLIFLLRALGYEEGTDFTWQTALDTALAIGLTDGRYAAEQTLTRGDAALLSRWALDLPLKGEDQTLRQALTQAGAIPAQGEKLTSEEVARLAEPAVFYLECYESLSDLTAGRPFAAGSGFFITADGVAVTNYHVIDGARYARIITSDGESYPVQSLIWSDEERDAAVLRISRTSVDGAQTSAFSALAISDTAPVTGQRVYAMGAPLGLAGTFADGLVSYPSRQVPGEKYPYIQITIPLSHGSSGGALLDEYGRVIGITTAGLPDGELINLAVPITFLDGVDLTAQGVSLAA